ncbi:MAG TPA: stage II sporulation protein E [Clostridiales bacterium]|nr:stage II sporulation protein E [Clostridiales bacterium]
MLHKDAMLPLNGWLNRSKTKRKASHFPTGFFIREVLTVLACFMIGRAVLFNQIAPFGMALYAILLSKRKGGLSAFLAVSAGLLSFHFGLQAVRSIIAMLLFCIVWACIGKKAGRWSVFRTAITVMLCLLSVYMVFSLMNGFLLYEVLIGLFESIVGFVMVYIFYRTADVLWDSKRRKVLSGEEMICLSIFLSLLIIGFWDIAVFNFSLQNILAVFLILLFAYMGGAGTGAAIGITTGFMLSLSSTPDPVLMGNLAICGLLAGTFKELGRPGSSIAFFLTNVLMTYYINRSTYIILPFGEIAGAVFLLMILPRKTIQFLKRFLSSGLMRADDQEAYGKRVQELTVGRLNEFARVFRHLSKVFGRISERSTSDGQEELSKLIDKVVCHTCKGCPLYRSCWERGFFRSYNNMFELMSVCEEKGYIEEKDVSQGMKRFCLQINNLVENINVLYHTYCTNLKWQQKLGDCRQLVAEQLEGVSHVVTELAAELDMDVRFRSGMEDAIRLELDKNGISVTEVLVLEKPGGKTEVNIHKPACGGNRECLKKVEAIVSQVLGKAMSRRHRDCTRAGKSDCTLHLSETRKYEIITGVARQPRHDSSTCGDSYSFTSVKDGKYMLALSDGMGSGARAAEESSAVISLMENFMEAGFNQNITIKTINSILMLRSREEMFATADLCVMDLVEGQAQFIKIGGVPSYIRRKGRVEIIRQPALPIGILEEVQLESISSPIQDEDMIVMVTDGILDAFTAVGDGEQALADFIATLDTVNPQELSDSIMQEALFHSDEEAKDDMTVMTGRVWSPY